MIVAEVKTTAATIAPVRPKPETTRLTWVDHARGIAILLVVYRHAVIGMRRAGLGVTPLMYNIQEVFYNFRMPVFFVLSGVFLFYLLKTRSFITVFLEKAGTLLYPYVLWGSVVIITHIYLTDYTNSKRHWTDLLAIFYQPREIAHLWYLFALFNTFLLFVILNKIIPNKWIHGIVAVGLYYLSLTSLLQGNSLLLDLCYYYPYLYAGTIAAPYLLEKEKATKILNVQNLIWLAPLFIIGQVVWFVNRNEEANTFPLFLVINFIACYFVYVISYKLSLYKSADWLSYLGKHSLYIYILHVFIASMLRNILTRIDAGMNVWIIFLVSWAGGVLIPIFLYTTLKRFGIEKLFVLRFKRKKMSEA